MAADEALLELSDLPVLRLYTWARPSTSFGYFGKFSEAEALGDGRDIVRRWTGGGMVLHEHDITYALIIPRHEAAFALGAREVYHRVHVSLQAALARAGLAAELVRQARAKVSEACFANPVPADLLLDGRKIAGAAQRRTRRGLLQQGSIQHEKLPVEMAAQFARALSHTVQEVELSDPVRQRAAELSRDKYGTVEWLRRR